MTRQNPSLFVAICAEVLAKYGPLTDANRARLLQMVTERMRQAGREPVDVKQKQTGELA